MPSLRKIWQEFVALWPIIGPTLGVVAGVVGKWLLDLLSKELSSRREYRQKMISLMIPKLHEYAEKYYMHEGAYADRSARDLEESLKESPVSDQQLIRTMFHLGKFLHALDERQRAIPAIFLQDLTGELLLSRLLRELIRKWDSSKVLDTQDRVRLREDAGRAGSIVEFENRLGANFKSLQDTFRRWLSDARTEASELSEALSLWSNLLLIETNYPYAVWYGRTPRVRLTEAQVNAVNGTLQLLRTEGRINEREELHYLKRLGLGVSRNFPPGKLSLRVRDGKLFSQDRR